ncbi:MAG: serine kinase [Gammaproteobacteria bacterium]|nr:MAG: serine kinase [Gammaproteobacteria bacterium]
MTKPNTLNCHHGVLMNINGHGVFIIGPAGIGKSSFALELLHLGHQLIADDVVEFKRNNNVLTGSCPQMSSGFLHSRELGLIAVTQLFSPEACIQQHTLNYVVELKPSITNTSGLSPSHSHEILGVNLPLLQLSINSTASLYHRLLTWLTMQSTDYMAEQELENRQQQQMNIGPK